MPKLRRIEVGQIIYGKYPRDYAHGGTHDFTPLAYTPDLLDEAVVNDIQLYLLGHTPPPPGAPTRRIFALVESRGAKLACVGELRPAEFPDVVGRTQQYLAHFLVMQQDEFLEQAGANPFYLFDNELMDFRFVQKIGEALDRLPEAQALRDVEFEAQREVGWDGLERWEGQDKRKDLRDLVRLALSARAQHGARVVLLGDHDRREKTLAGLMALLSPEDRLHCTFNTDAGRVAQSPDGRYGVWASGMAQSPPAGGVARVDVDRCEVHVDEPARQVEAGPYGEWLLWRLGHSDGEKACSDAILEDRTAALQAVRIINGEQTDWDKAAWDALEPVIGEVAQLRAVQDSLYTRAIEAWLGNARKVAPGIAEDATVREWLRAAEPQAHSLVEAARGREALLPLLVKGRLAKGGRMSRDEARDWRRLVPGTQDSTPPRLMCIFAAGLDLFLSTGPERDRAAENLRAAIETADRDEPVGVPYAHAVGMLLRCGLATLVEAYVPGRARDLVRTPEGRSSLVREPSLILSLAEAFWGRGGAQRDRDFQALDNVPRFVVERLSDEQLAELDNYNSLLPGRVVEILDRRLRGVWAKLKRALYSVEVRCAMWVLAGICVMIAQLAVAGDVVQQSALSRSELLAPIIVYALILPVLLLIGWVLSKMPGGGTDITPRRDAPLTASHRTIVVWVVVLGMACLATPVVAIYAAQVPKGGVALPAPIALALLVVLPLSLIGMAFLKPSPAWLHPAFCLLIVIVSVEVTSHTTIAPWAFDRFLEMLAKLARPAG